MSLPTVNDAVEGFKLAAAMYAAPVPPTPFEASVRRILTELGDMLIAKNEAYGDSALNPVRMFSRADPVEQIRVRLDDKLSRLARGTASGEDVVNDLMGYLVLLKIAEGRTG